MDNKAMASTDSPTVAVLLTCHNRVEKTLRCLKVVFQQQTSDPVNIQVVLVDDGSTDGTGQAVRERFPAVQVIEGDGSLFWNRGMHRAFAAALEDRYDYYLWLNDDTLLHEDALEVLLAVHQEKRQQAGKSSIVIASTRDPRSGEFSYGGYRQYNARNPLKLYLVHPSDKPEPCDTFCGNCVLIPREVAEQVGNIDPIYKHRWGDVDYGLRAREEGYRIWIAPGYLAECEDNPNADKWRNTDMPFGEKIRELHSIKGVTKVDWLYYVRRHGGMFWPLIWIRPYLRIFYDTAKHTSERLVKKITQ